jgi:WD repeat-containing protein 70
MSLKVELSGHAKAVTCISVEPAGNRLVTGSLDYAAKMFDFGGMDRLIHN